MEDNVIWRTNKYGKRFPITNEYMNNFIRSKNKKNKNNETVTLYHGSPYKFDKFDLNKSRENQHYMNVDKGHYFTDDEEIARELYGEDGYVYEVRVPKDKVKKSSTYLGQGDYEDKIYVVDDDDAINVVKRNKINKYYNKYNVKEELDDINKKIKTKERLYDRFKDNPDFIKDYNEAKERREWLNSIPKYDEGNPVSLKTKLYSINEDIRKIKKNMEKDKESGNLVSYDYLSDRLKEVEKRKQQLEKQSKKE